MRTSSLFVGFVFGGLVAACVASTADETEFMTGTEESAITGPNGEPTCANPKKELICHIPPGNPANAHTICVSDHAVATHTSHHGDTIGPCGPADDGDDGDDGDEPPPDDGEPPPPPDGEQPPAPL